MLTYILDKRENREITGAMRDTHIFKCSDFLKTNIGFFMLLVLFNSLVSHSTFPCLESCYVYRGCIQEVKLSL